MTLRTLENVFTEGEDVVIFEKLNGQNCAVVWDGEQLHVRSRNFWKKEGNNPCWMGVKNNPEVIEFCKENPNLLVYGEVYGHVGGWPYDTGVGKWPKPFFRPFDILQANRKFLDTVKFIDMMNNAANYIPFAPILYTGPFSIDMVYELAEGQSKLSRSPNPHIKEGVVIKPLTEQHNWEIGRVVLKCVGIGYLQKD